MAYDEGKKADRDGGVESAVRGGQWAEWLTSSVLRFCVGLSVSKGGRAGKHSGNYRYFDRLVLLMLPGWRWRMWSSWVFVLLVMCSVVGVGVTMTHCFFEYSRTCFGIPFGVKASVIHYLSR